MEKENKVNLVLKIHRQFLAVHIISLKTFTLQEVDLVKFICGVEMQPYQCNHKNIQEKFKALLLKGKRYTLVATMER